MRVAVNKRVFNSCETVSIFANIRGYSNFYGSESTREKSQTCTPLCQADFPPTAQHQRPATNQQNRRMPPYCVPSWERLALKKFLVRCHCRPLKYHCTAMPQYLRVILSIKQFILNFKVYTYLYWRLLTVTTHPPRKPSIFILSFFFFLILYCYHFMVNKDFHLVFTCINTYIHTYIHRGCGIIKQSPKKTGISRKRPGLFCCSFHQ